jgi:RNA polymerase sigma-70 factor (ECF subfamily)
MRELNDIELMALLADGNRDSLRELYRRFEMAVFNFLLRYTGSREISQELLQDSFVRLWNTAARFDQARGTVRAWLFTIALNLARNEMSKKEHSRRQVSAGDITDQRKIQDRLPGMNPEEVLQERRLFRDLKTALASLAPHLREVVVLKHYHDCKFSEMAQITATPESTLKARYHKAVAELRRSLETAEGGL